MDGYNRFPRAADRWLSFERIFVPAHRFAVAHDKGMLVEETGTLEQTDGGHRGDPRAKAQWFKDMAATVKAWPEVVGIEYSNTVADYRGHPMAYEVETSQASMDAFRSVAQDPYFN